jgi:type VI secretion system protein ImpA
MTAIDVAALLEPVSEGSPCGPSVEYDEEYIDLEKAARGVAREEDASGKVVREAEPPNWPEVERLALELTAKSKDLRVAIYLARARLAVDGLPGFSETLGLIDGYLRDFWPSVHPQLDPADDNDPSIRVNTLAALCHNETVLRELRLAPLTQSRQFGRISYRDYAVAAGLTPPPPPARGGDERPPDASRIEAAFADTSVEALQEVQQAAAASLQHLGSIDETLTEHLGAGNGPDFTPLEKQVGEIKGVLDKELAKRGGGEQEIPVDGESSIAPHAVGSGGMAAAGVMVRSREDVLLLLDRICRYYSDFEPSSPVPLILNRTKRLVTMNFLDILKDLTPGGVQEFGVVAGIKAEAEED